VVNFEKNQEGAERVVAEIRGASGRAIAVRCDVSNRSEVEAMFKAAVDEFGKVDVLVDNAAVYSEAPLLEVTEEAWDRTLDVNLKGVFLCMQAAARHMVPRRYGKIVNISSIAGVGVAGTGEAAYSASKAGVIQLTKSVAFELGQYGINVNCIAPGAIQTDMLKGKMTDQEYADFLKFRKSGTTLGTIGEPEDIANAALFLASDEARFITGKTLIIDGGRRDFI
jgi:NAD(P)-dependent dehydrogenase (short-subunit alcohol dehydrogenase family)